VSETNVSESTENESQPKQKRYYPPIRTWVISIFFLAFGLIGWSGQTLGNGPLASFYDKAWFFRDAAICNVLLLIGVFVSIAVPLFWFTFQSHVSASKRFIPLGVALLAVFGFFAVFEIKGVNGMMIPRLGYRFEESPDQKLSKLITVPEQPAKSAEPADPDVEYPEPFPQFLGPNRNSKISDIKISTNWDENPPEEIWRTPIGSGWSSFVAAKDRAYTMEQLGDKECVTCFDVQTGERIWQYAIEARHHSVMGYTGPRSTPLLVNDNVYATGATGMFHCLDQATGELLWQHNLLEMYNVTPEQEAANIAWGRAPSPVAYQTGDQTLIIIPAGGPNSADPETLTSLVAFDSESGDKVWEAGDQQISYASPSVFQVGGKDQIFSINEKAITGHAPETGNVLWTMDWAGNSNGNASCSQVHALPDGKFFVSKGYGQGARVFTLNPTDEGKFTPEIVWDSSRVLKTKFTNVAIKDGFAYGLNDGILEKVDLENGKPEWRTRGFGHGQVLMLGETMLVMSEEGELAAVDPDSPKFNELARIKALSGDLGLAWNPLCLYGDLLLVRNAEEAACYRLDVEQED